MTVATGISGNLDFDGTFVTISPHKGLKGLVRSRGKSERRVPMKSITEVEFSEPTMAKIGYIRVLTSGMQPLRGTTLRPAFMDAMQDPNAVTFDKKTVESFRELRNRIELALV
ncbi:DUF4429 domain-containing protein [Kineosporia sp. A_224]|uniref:DUF4429 domain-containing protein n=1 Tax=Kineosporia sp. A_224 TaxID=1962180 RepID=UPI0013044C89|nr:DUF4429 domain-containing protein [Kineosporia sp. A_224]